MSDPYVGQVKIFGFGFAPLYFAQCNGQILPVAQNQALYSLLANIYGGNGTQTFALPDLRGRSPLGTGSSGGATYSAGNVAGAETVTLSVAQLPTHTHSVGYSNLTAGTRNPANGLYGDSGTSPLYGTGGTVALNPATVTPAGGDQPHPNMQPFTTLNFCIALTGLYPVQS
jgi:microcystin-dependent protein